MAKTVKIKGAGAPFEICWDHLGIPHVFAQNRANAFIGMGYTAGYERLWQIHLSCLYANGCAASELGRRFLMQDALLRTFNVPAAGYPLPESDGDWVVEAFLAGLNAYIDDLPEVPAEFKHAGTEPRHFTRTDIASRYRFSSWIQHRSWVEKIYLAKLMAGHGVEYWKNHVRRFSKEDEKLVELLKEPFLRLDPIAARLLNPDLAFSGSNNWAVRSRHSASGAPMLATDPHQPFSIPNTFFFVHLSASDWDAFGASLPGLPYFMMGYNSNLAWGLTTGFVDNYDVYIEKVDPDNPRRYLTPQGWELMDVHEETIEIKGEKSVKLQIWRTRHGPVLETLYEQLEWRPPREDDYRTAVKWTLGLNPTSAGTLALLPLAETSEEFGRYLFENNVTPLVNNIICVDRQDDLRRWVAATLPKREGITGILPFPGWDAQYDFPQSTAEDVFVEHNPDCGFTATANNDTMGERGSFPIHNFPANSARADRIIERLEAEIDRGKLFTPAVFESIQNDLTDLRARELVPQLLSRLEQSDDPDVIRAYELLSAWDFKADLDSAAACLYYVFLTKLWHLDFIERVLSTHNLDIDLIKRLALTCPGLNLFRISDFMKEGSPWAAWPHVMDEVIAGHMKASYLALRDELGEESHWAWGDLHQVQFWHTLRQSEPWKKLTVGPDPIGGSATTPRMTLYMGPGVGPSRQEGQLAFRVYHGPVYRLIVDLADPFHARFVIAGGNSSRPDSKHILDHYQTWLAGDYFTLALKREEIDVEEEWFIENE